MVRLNRRSWLKRAGLFVPAACSIIRCRSDGVVIQGPVMRTMASGTVPIVPTDVANLKVWYKSDGLLYQTDHPNDDSVCTNGTNVADWHDSSGNGWQATMTTAGNRPIFYTSVQNSLPGVFSGTDRFMTNTSVTWSSAARTVFAAVKTPASLAAFGHICATAVTAEGMEIYLSSAGTGYKWSMFNGTVRNSATAPAVSTAYTVRGVFDGASSTLHVNNVELLSAGNAGTNNGAGCKIMVSYDSADKWQGHLFELFIYDSASLSAGNISGLETYLNGRWAIY